MDYEEKLINGLKQIKRREDINSGQHIYFILKKAFYITKSYYLYDYR